MTNESHTAQQKHEWLISQHIPGGKNFAEITDADIIAIQKQLNNRLRKSLSDATPNEVFSELMKQIC